jgi:hypothetical protein
MATLPITTSVNWCLELVMRKCVYIHTDCPIGSFIINCYEKCLDLHHKTNKQLTVLCFLLPWCDFQQSSTHKPSFGLLGGGQYWPPKQHLQTQWQNNSLNGKWTIAACTLANLATNCTIMKNSTKPMFIWKAKEQQRTWKAVGKQTMRCSHLTLSDPTSDLVWHYDFPVPLQWRKTSDTFFFVTFVLPLRCRSLSDAFPHVVWTSNPPTSFQPKINKSRGVCGWQNKLDWKGLIFGLPFIAWNTVTLRNVNQTAACQPTRTPL